MIDSSSRGPLPQSRAPRKWAGLTTAPVSRAGRPAVEHAAANRWRTKSSAEQSAKRENDERRGDRANVIYSGMGGLGCGSQREETVLWGWMAQGGGGGV